MKEMGPENTVACLELSVAPRAQDVGYWLLEGVGSAPRTAGSWTPEPCFLAPGIRTSCRLKVRIALASSRCGGRCPSVWSMAVVFGWELSPESLGSVAEWEPRADFLTPSFSDH